MNISALHCAYNSECTEDWSVSLNGGRPSSQERKKRKETLAKWPPAVVLKRGWASRRTLALTSVILIIIRTLWFR